MYVIALQSLDRHIETRNIEGSEALIDEGGQPSCKALRDRKARE